VGEVLPSVVANIMSGGLRKTSLSDSVMIRSRLIALMAVALMAASCGHSKPIEDQVNAFHRAFNDGQFNSIYDAASEDLKRTSDRKSFITFLGKARQRLGPARASHKLVEIQGKFGDIPVLLVSYRTDFEKLTTCELFLFTPDDRALLSGYQIRERAVGQPNDKRRPACGE
jgi:hypothetical protein